jgi:hypothetical protein
MYKNEIRPLPHTKYKNSKCFNSNAKTETTKLLRKKLKRKAFMTLAEQ